MNTNPTSSPISGLLLGLVSACAISACGDPTSHEVHGSGASAYEGQWILPGEFEPVHEVIMGWDESVAPYFREALPALAGHARITFVLDPTQDDTALDELIDEVKGIQSPDQALDVGILDMAIDSLWLRDFGPLVTKNQGQRRIVDLDYWSLGANDELAESLATHYLSLETDPVPLEFEGGNLQADGVGNCIASTSVLAANVDKSAKEIREILRLHFGCQHTELLPPLPGEQTEHVDMFLSFTAPAELIVGRGGPDHSQEVNDHLERVAAHLRDGGYLVRRVPMPFLEDGLFRTYTNSLAVNDVVLVPYYSDSMDGLQEALKVFEEAYPGRAIIPIEASTLIKLNGSIHCTAMTTAR